eukprot:CAMPEP_0115160924 /NCGR_PEP_ID=MMETSP0227-20121206/71071_1 /TAXON_ID=89957 /ORGANISM="Polarella glacialis, Strain CCMP 1383" /LENGTH=50 /DNA_ID=CAMNT_0002572867 /DNA_START=167 /DNA_END=319 /DNA_ORIENTATION=-
MTEVLHLALIVRLDDGSLGPNLRRVLLLLADEHHLFLHLRLHDAILEAIW